MNRKKILRLVAPVAALALVASACSSDDKRSTSSNNMDMSDMSSNRDATLASQSGAATLRAGLTGLLTEHVYLAALTSGAALRSDMSQFEAYAAALNGETDSNTADLTDAITSAYGEEVGTAFDGLWRSEDHIPAFVAYTQAVAANDTAAADQAVADLTAYAKTVGTTLNSVNSNLPAAAVEDAVTHHAETLIAVIDAQKAGDQTAVYTNLRTAYAQMNDLAETLAGATAAKFPEKFDGDASSPAADLRAGMTSLLREHVLLAASATGGALGGRQPQFDAAAAARDGAANSNTSWLVDGIGTIYGEEVGTAVDGLWRSEGHIPAFVAYTQALAADDTAAADAAVAALTAYAKTFGTTLSSVNPNLPAADVEASITEHATTLLAVIDAQKAGNAVQAATLLREAVAHMSMTADVLADATVMQYPDQF